MKRTIVKLSEQELNTIIAECVNKALNEIGGKTLSIIPNVAIDAVDNIQKGNLTKKINVQKSTSYDNQITKADALYPKAIQSFLQPYKDKKLMFFAYKREGNPVHLIFSIENIKKLIDGIAILSGVVIFGGEQLSGDIIVDFTKDKVSYKYIGNNYKYVLEPDQRTLVWWNNLCDGLRESLNNRLKRG